MPGLLHKLSLTFGCLVIPMASAQAGMHELFNQAYNQALLEQPAAREKLIQDLGIQLPVDALNDQQLQLQVIDAGYYVRRDGTLVKIPKALPGKHK